MSFSGHSNVVKGERRDFLQELLRAEEELAAAVRSGGTAAKQAVAALFKTTVRFLPSLISHKSLLNPWVIFWHACFQLYGNPISDFLCFHTEPTMHAFRSKGNANFHVWQGRRERAEVVQKRIRSEEDISSIAGAMIGASAEASDSTRVAVGCSNRVLIYGGFVTGERQSFAMMTGGEICDFGASSQQWATVSSANHQRGAGGIARLGDYLYIVGGFDGRNARDDVERLRTEAGVK